MQQRFSDFYATHKPVFSLEVFPPKTEKGVSSLLAELELLKQIHPAFVSVTYGAMGSTRDLTKDLALRIKNETHLTPAIHFTCVGSSRDEVKKYVTMLADQGVNLVVALRGDKPVDAQNFTPPTNGFRYASELVAYLKTLYPFSMAVAGYPEKHVEALSFESDLENLKRKVNAGADVVITQLFFDNADYKNYVERVRAMGVSAPIIPGILPVQSLKQVERIVSLIGAKLPPALHQKLLACGDDETAMREVGITHATEQCRDLLRFGVPGIHFYALNKAHSVLKIVAAL